MSAFRVAMHRVTSIEIGQVGTYGFELDITSTASYDKEKVYESLDIFNAACGESSEELRETRKLLVNLQSSIEDRLKLLNSKIEEALKLEEEQNSYES